LTDRTERSSPPEQRSKQAGAPSVIRRLSVVDRYLPAWIALAMAAGLGLGRAFPGLDDQLDRVRVGQTSLPIALGLLGMMYPVLARVRYGRLRDVTSDRPLMASSLVLNWLVGPALMFALAWLFLPDLPEFRMGLIMIGLARCIAMVLIWNTLACGDNEAAAVLVVLNSLFQVLTYSFLGYFYIEVLPGWLHLEQASIDVSLWEIARSVLIFLGVPLAAGFVTSLIGRGRKGDAWYDGRFLPRIGPLALYSLLFTIVLLFAIQGEAITSHPFDVVRIAFPLMTYFALMWGISFAWGYKRGFSYANSVTLAFTAAGNNFELAIAVSIATFGVSSGQAVAGVVGPLIEVPALVGLVYVALRLQSRFRPAPSPLPAGTSPHRP
jgi:ACR3 family arsenite transporter